MYRSKLKISGRQKAAILLVSLGKETAAKIFKRLTREEAERLTLEIANLHKIDSSIRDEVLIEFRNMRLAKEHIDVGGVDYAEEILYKALGQEEAAKILAELSVGLQVQPFEFARRADPAQLFEILKDEQPQTIALVLAYLEPNQAALILSSLHADVRTEVARRIAEVGSVSQEVLSEVEDIFTSKLSIVNEYSPVEVGGVEGLAKILGDIDRASEKSILESIENRNPELAEKIRKRLFVIDDIVLLDTASIAKVLRVIEPRDLRLAIKGATAEVQEYIYKNISKRMAETIKEDLEVMGPVRLRDVETAQQRISMTIRRLEEQGEIIMQRGSDEDVFI